MKTSLTAIALVAAAALGVGSLAWKCVRDVKINFLPADARAEWIIFPAAIDARTHRVAMMDAIFRRTLIVESQPASAQLLFRAAKRLELKINGEAVEIAAPRNWKKIAAVEVSKFLRAGSNTIEARVFNDNAPPALWLCFHAGAPNLKTDSSWQASIAGSSWRNCALASVARHPGAGNFLSGGEKISNVLSRILPAWGVFAVIASLLVIAARWLSPNADVDFTRREVLLLLGICASAWALLFWNNTRLLPFHCGYDYTDHIAYIKYVQDRRALPLPNEGYEMFQPPLYYALSAAVLSICRLSVADASAVVVLRAMTMVFGIVNFAVVFLTLRLLFPRRRWLQIIGLLMAAFLPMQLYLSHYVTNETLAATLVSAAVYCALRILKIDGSSVWPFITLGMFTGAAMLTKATSVLFLLPLFGALVIKLAQKNAQVAQWFRALGITVATMFAVSGWHYIRIWRHFGKPIVGNWDPALGFPWWQDPGFHVARDYFRFGQALINPLFSGFNGFADGIYSTIWGDSLGGGLSGVLSRTPWNYPLMSGGYWLAIVPTILVVIGVAVALFRFSRDRSPEWFLLIGFSAAVALALIFMTLEVPSYAQVKAFYGLSAIIPFCCFLVLGWETVTRRSRSLQIGLIAFLVIFATNSFASVWIRSSAEQHIYAAGKSIAQSQSDRALSEASEATRIEPSNAKACCFYASVLAALGDSPKAVAQLERGLELDSANADCHLQLGINLAKEKDTIRAMTEARYALDAQPENRRAYDLIISLARELHRPEEAIAVGRDALVISPFDPDLHYRIGLAAGEIGDFTTASHQFAYALLLQPNRSEIADKLRLAVRFAAQSWNALWELRTVASSLPDSAPLLNELAWLFATDTNSSLRDGARGVELADRACTLTERKKPEFLVTAAAAHAEAGQFAQAVDLAREAESVAKKTGDAKTASLAENMLPLFQSNQPYREEMQ